MSEQPSLLITIARAQRSKPPRLLVHTVFPEEGKWHDDLVSAAGRTQTLLLLD